MWKSHVYELEKSNDSMPILPKAMCRFNIYTIQYLYNIRWYVVHKLTEILKFMGSQNPWKAKCILIMKYKVTQNVIFPDFEIYLKPTVIKTL